MFIFRNKHLFFPFSRQWSKILLFITGVKVKVNGQEILYVNETYIFITNHSSLFDIPIILGTLTNYNVAIIYKKELEKVPFFGIGLKASPFIPVVREDPRSSLTSIENAVESINKGISVLVFPEGTRSKDGKVGEFKRGAFLLASRSGMPIVPIAINGSWKIMPNKKLFFSGGVVDITIHSPIRFTLPLDRNSEKKLMNDVYSSIKDSLENG
ncbi:MAG: 1-acyl-sn-glycerol-3-phosphate acyltransferase [Ignavibacteria bacterium]|nr:1-acyl-sn-glycerol-3-phosphate acyltransferase [Ignavibacteria bacterium]